MTRLPDDLDTLAVLLLGYVLGNLLLLVLFIVGFIILKLS